MRACTVSLNSRVRAISFLLRLSRLVARPPFLHGRDVAVLALLGPAAEQDDKGVAVFPEIDSVPRAEVDPVFEDASADPFDIRKVSQLHPKKCRRYLRCGAGIETTKPFRERARAIAVEKLPNRHRPN